MKFVTRRAGAWYIQCVNTSDLDAVVHLTALDYPLHPRDLGHWDRPLPEGVVPVHGGDRANVFKVEVGGHFYCVKVFHDQRLHVRVRNFIRFSKARRAFSNGLKLEQLGISVPKTFALSCRRFGGPQLLVTEFAGDGEAVRTRLMKDSRESERLLAACAEFTRKLAEKGVFHIDYGARNILLDGTQLLLIDLEDVVFSRKESDALEEKLRQEFLLRMKRNSLKSEGF